MEEKHTGVCFQMLEFETSIDEQFVAFKYQLQKL